MVEKVPRDEASLEAGSEKVSGLLIAAAETEPDGEMVVTSAPERRVH
jgi:hypothetical protein